MIRAAVGFDGSRNDTTLLRTVFPPNDVATRLFENFRDRFTSSRDLYDNGRRDAITTLRAFETIYTGILGVFNSAHLMGLQSNTGINNGCKRDLILLLFQILDAIVGRAQDPRSHGGQVYAGGTQQYEYNLWHRFSRLPNEWSNFVGVLDALRGLPQAVGFFRDNIGQLQTTYQTLAQRYPQGHGLDQSQLSLIQRLRAILTAMG